ncbi:MAG: translocation/assembly module TamB domain-containing protein [Prolixibacteraceae bacterium]|nr:translocation/assembly module TamB domain-containing protein [Prolixibacteraceae bacterium]
MLIIFLAVISLVAGIIIALQTSMVQTFIAKRIALVLSEKTDATVAIGKAEISFFKKIVLQDLLIEDQKSDTLLFANTISANIDTLKFRGKKLVISQLNFTDNQINLGRDSTGKFNFIFLLDSLKSPVKKDNKWQITCNSFGFSESGIVYKNDINNQNEIINIYDINFGVSNFKLINDSVRFNIDKLTFNDGNGFKINQLQSVFSFRNGLIKISDLNFQTEKSEINNSKFIIELPSEGVNDHQTMQMDLQFADSRISLYDISLILPELRGMNQVIYISGQIFGGIDDLKGKNIIVKTGENTTAALDFITNGMSDPGTMYLFLDLKNSTTTFKDISKIKLPESAGTDYLRFPESFYEAGTLSYKGNFAGFLTDFVTYGTVTSKMGILTTDVSVIPDEEGRVTYRGKIVTENFQLGDLFKTSTIGTITFDGSVDGYFDKADQSLAGAFEGDIEQMEIYDYNYKNIKIDGILNNRMFDGLVLMNDSNLAFDFLGTINLNPDVPAFDFHLDLKNIMPGKLNLSETFPASEMSFIMNAKFSGNKIDNLAGSIKVENGYYKNRNGELNLKGFELRSITGGPMKHLSFTSDFFDAEINGNYYFQDILNAFKKSLNRYIPVIHYEELTLDKQNKFGYQLDVQNLDDILNVFAPGYKIETPFLLYGMLDSENSIFELKGSIPGFSSQAVFIKNIFIGNSPGEDLYSSRFRFGEILLKNGMSLKNVTFDSKIDNNVINNKISWNNDESISYSGQVETRATFSETADSSKPHIDIEGLPAELLIADTLWQINPFTATIDSTTVNISDFNFFSSGQRVGIDGTISKELSDILTVSLNNINLGNIGAYLNKEVPLRGLANGTVGINDFYGKRLLFSDLNVDGFNFKNQDVGDITMNNKWNSSENMLISEVFATSHNRKSLHATGYFNPVKNEINYDAEFDNFSLVLIETLIRRNFSNFHGDASGNLKIHGSPQKILMDGKIKGTNAGLTIDYTQVSYHFSDSVTFSGDTIRFNKITIRDVAGNSGTFNGTIIHDNFKNMQYNLSAVSGKITVMNTTPAINPKFFGQVVARCNITITGRGKNVILSGTGTTLNGTNVNISLESQSEIERYDFIHFVSTEDTERQEFLFPGRDNSDFTMNLTIYATPEARAQLIYNSQIGDVIKAQGEGVLVFGMDKEGSITLSGNYAVERGDYLFTLQNVINKRFTIQQGGTINWSGDPYNANINISAVYKLKASLYDLLVNTYDNIYQSQRIPVECNIILTEELSNPLIDFAINFPSVEDRLKEELRQYFSTPEELNKQILSLVVLGKFYTPDYMRGTYEAQNPNLIGTTASELFSNQLSNWLSQINSNLDIGLNYRPGNQITNNEIELALSTQMFNDRVTINGNIGNNNNPNSSNNSQLVGDFEVNVKLNPSGKIQLKAYNRSNNNLIYETAPYTQGVGFSITEEYNSFKNLLNKIVAIFTRKEET